MKSKVRERGKQATILVCLGCRKRPHELVEYVNAARDEGCSPVEYVWSEEGTLNRTNGHFLCTECYVTAGMPSSPHGWRAP